LGLALYYFLRPPFIHDILQNIEPLSRGNVDIDGITRLAGFIWLFAAIPVLKGLAQIIYASLFAESIATLSERFIPRPAQVVTAPQLSPPKQEEEPPRSFEDLSAPLLSVTDHTTQIIEAPSGPGRARTAE